MKPPDLIKAGDILLGANSHRPSQAALRRAVSTYYYALFHCLARECADLLIGATKSRRSDRAWRQVYRALEHGHAHTRCKDRSFMKSFPKEIEDFATTFVTMQDMRHDADYDPMASFSKSQAEVAGRLVTGAIESFRKVPVQHRRAFCAYVLLRKRTGWAGGKQGWGHMETGRRGGGEKKEARVLLRLLLPAFPSPCESSRLSPPRDRGSTADFRSLTWTGDRTEYFR